MSEIINISEPKQARKSTAKSKRRTRGQADRDGQALDTIADMLTARRELSWLGMEESASDTIRAVLAVLRLTGRL